MVVNNNAAAVLLVLAALARDRQVVVSRGESVEIGGGFRIPEVMEQSGARLVDVGTTNRTRLADYRKAIGRKNADVAAVLKVHPSNYRVEGFVEATSVAELATLGVPVIADIGSGLIDANCPWLGGPPPGVAAWRAGGPPVARRRRRAGDVQRRQAVRRAAGRHHRRPCRPRRRCARSIHWPGRCDPAPTCWRRCSAPRSPISTERPPPRSRSGRWSRRPPTTCRPGPARSSPLPVSARSNRRRRCPGAGSAPGAPIPRSVSASPAISSAVLRSCTPPVIARTRDGCDVARPAHGRTRQRRRRCRGVATMRVVATAGHVDHGKSSLVRGADRHRPRPLRGGTQPRADDRPRLRPHDAARRRRASASSTCPATSGSCATCWPASAASTPACSSSPPPRGGSRRARSTCASSSWSASATGSSP